MKISIKELCARGLPCDDTRQPGSTRACVGSPFPMERGMIWVNALRCLRRAVLGSVVLLGGMCTFAHAQGEKVVTYYLADPQGSVLVTADANGIVTGSTDYRPYGEQTVGLASSPSYTGHLRDDESGLVYAQQRYYDPQMGRFLSVDPLDVKQSEGRNFSRYWYGSNNPYRYTDPDGREVTCTQDTCTAVSNSLFTLAVDYSTLAALYTKRLIENATQPSQTTQNHSSSDAAPPVATPEPGTAESDEGCIYCVDGANTESGKDYVGSADDLGRRAATAKDGRDRTDATKVDSYKKGDRTDRQNKEQKAINERGGRDKLDNRRNEVAPDKWASRDIPPPPPPPPPKP